MATNPLPQLSNIESDLLIKFVEYADKHQLTRVDTNNIHGHAKEFGIRPIFLKATFDKLCQKEILSLTRERRYEGDDDYYYEINGEYVDQIEAYYDFMISKPSDLSSPQEIPAADRFVTVADNQPEKSMAIEVLNALSAAVLHPLDTNEPLTADPNDQIRLSREVDYINEIVSQPRIHVSALWDAVKHNNTLKWLTEQTISGVVRDLAVKAFAHLGALLSSLV